MAAFQFGYGNPANFSDWTTYAGLDRKTGQFAQRAARAGVPPPESFSDFVGQAVAPVRQAVTNFGNAASQLGQGNFSQAYKGMTAIANPLNVPPTPEPSGYDYITQIGQ